MTHKDIEFFCLKLGMAAPPHEENNSKAQRLLASFDATPDAELPKVATHFLEHSSPSARDRNQIQDLLWQDSAYPEINKKVRRNIARALESEQFFLRADGFDRLINRVWVLDSDFDLPWVDSNSLKKKIERHVYNNPGDWSMEDLFENLGALEASDRRFAIFLEGLASADVRPDEAAQKSFVSKINAVLLESGSELREIGNKEGYPVFSLVSVRTPPAGTPKNIIFASPLKPDLRFIDAVSNDIEIVTNADKVLVYDRALTADGLRWRDLQKWWSESQKIADATQAKKSLYKRLLSSLPESSPPQTSIFVSYHQEFGKAIPDLPALLPEVWLHWDPKTVKERGPQALLRFRMDFLMLFPHGVRVVIEVDGKQHYAQDNGQADVSRYAKMAAADRELKLSGYEVFRFGAEELRGDQAHDVARTFFESLFKRYRVNTS